MTELTLAKLKTELASDAAETCGFKSTRQFLDVWKAAGYRTPAASPRKRVVFTSDIAKFLSERVEPLTQPMVRHL